MIPKSFSATALQVAQACPARYAAEMFKKGAQFSGTAAQLGTALHGALEDYVRGIKIHRDTAWSLDVLLALFDLSFANVFGYDNSVPEYKDGRAILTKWYNRPYMFDDIMMSETLSMEHKDTLPLPVMINGVKERIPFTFIIDRLDRIGPGEYRVVDYKSQRQPIQAEDLYSKIQARAYAVAVATKYKDAAKIWVEFDLLRHEKVAAVFTRNDNIESWKILCRAAQQVIDTPEDEAEERLNTECTYCIRKATCTKLMSNIDAGGLLGLSLDDMAIKLHDAAAQIKAATSLKNDLEKQLLLAADEMDVMSFDTERAKVIVTSFSRRDVNSDQAEKIVGPEIARQYGRITVPVVEELLNGDKITSGQKAALQRIITKKPSNPGIKVTKK